MSRSGKGNLAIWDYYVKKQNDKIAKCNICKKNISFKTTITNLKQHLKHKHTSVFNEFLSRSLALPGSRQTQNNNIRQEPDHDDADDDSDNVNRMEETQQGSEKVIWSVFNKETNSNDGEEDVFKDVVFLEGSFTQPQPNSSKSAKRPIASRYSTKPQLSISEIIVDSVNTPKKSHQDEEIEKFTTYITHLLKTVTPEQCSKIQMEIIILIMKEKLKKPEASVQTPQWSLDFNNRDVIVVKSTDAEVDLSMEDDACST